MSEQLLLDISQVCKMVNLCRRTLYRLMNRGEFPKPKMVPGVRGHRWTRASIQRWAERLPENVEAGCE